MDQQPLPLIEHPRKVKRVPKPPRPPKPPRDPHAPIPLRDPRGVVRAYACVHCRRVSMSSESFGTDARRLDAEHSREGAARCCVCRCGMTIDRKVRLWRSECADCEAAWQASREAPTGEMVPCGDCAGTGSLPATTPDGRSVTADCAACDGDGEVWQSLAAP